MDDPTPGDPGAGVSHALWRNITQISLSPWSPGRAVGWAVLSKVLCLPRQAGSCGLGYHLQTPLHGYPSSAFPQPITGLRICPVLQRQQPALDRLLQHIQAELPKSLQGTACWSSRGESLLPVPFRALELPLCTPKPSMCLHGSARESTGKKDCYKTSVGLKGRRVLGVFSTARRGESGLAGLQGAGKHSEHRTQHFVSGKVW